MLRYRFAGAYRDIGLGKASGPGTVSLADARKAAAIIRAKISSGIDPISEQRIKADQAQADAAKRVTFRDVAEIYLAANADSWKNAKHRAQWQQTLQSRAFPVIGAMPVADIDTPHVLAIIEPIWQSVPETASRIRGRIETILDAAKVRGFRRGDNPARWRGHLSLLLPAPRKLARGHHAALPYDQIPAFIARLHEREAVSALALEFTILTAARTGEVIGAKWSEFDRNAGIWTVPPTRMKAGREHRVPLSPRTLEILDMVEVLGGEHVFPAPRGGAMSNMAMALLLRRMGLSATVHGFRSAFRDWSAEQSDHSREVAEMALAHVIESRVERAYRRGDLLEKRRELMNDWAAYCATACTQMIAPPVRS